jgi:tRNA uridine 5-carboxymethylaminomethyl modification enzyme
LESNVSRETKQFMKYDIIVVGGGHAGIEASNIPTKRNLKVLLITSHLDLIGQMSCNPSIGGIAKGNIVREIDAMGGLMAKITDKAGIHFRMLNKSKGTAVWGNRAQADKVLYRSLSKRKLEKNQYIDIMQAFVYHIMNDGKKCSGVILDSGEKIYAKAVILCMGTFLNGVAHIGLNEFPSGRTGEPPSLKLTESINEYGIKSGRLKTGTSPRIDGRSVDYSKWEVQCGDEKPWPFSFSTKENVVNRVTCWTSRTKKETHTIIKENLDRSPLYSGKIKSVGPRYCPSIEDKIMKFGDREGHSLFLEPESLSNNELYLNGLSTSLPYDVQEKMVHSIDGLENAIILRPGYGIEYDYFPPTQLKRTLESKIIDNLYFAGQINGTSGYEEAACQGLLAAVNASQKILSEDEIILNRDSSYAAVLIDDLVTKGTDEPYRMFTSRAEYRILLRQDNCDERLMPLFYKYGYLDKENYSIREKEWNKRKLITETMKSRLFYIKDICHDKVESTQKYKMNELIKRPEISLISFKDHVDFIDFEDEMLIVSIESDIKYEGFISKQKEEVERNEKLENTIIPDSFDYDTVKGLLNESRIKMQNIRPYTLGQASRIPGVTPADISILTMHLIKFRHLKSFT